MGAHAPFTVQGFCKKTGGAGLSNSSWAGEKIGMGDSSLLDCILQGGYYKFLSHQLGEILWSFSCCSYFIGHEDIIASNEDMGHHMASKRGEVFPRPMP